MNELHLFAGAGGGILGGILLGHTTVCAVEIEPYCRKVLLQRQRDGILPKFPIWDDVQTFNGKHWKGKVDVVCGGFPCQDISAAGKGAGIEGSRSSMWKHMARIIGEIRPKYAFVENSPMLVGRGLTTVLADLAEMGYHAKWGIVGAHNVSAPHQRNRIWILATDSNVCRCDNVGNPKRKHEIYHAEVRKAEKDQQSRNLWEHRSGENGRDVGDSTIERFQNRTKKPMGQPRTDAKFKRSDWWATEPDVGRVAHGVASRVDRLKAIGNGQVPAVAQLAWDILKS